METFRAFPLLVTTERPSIETEISSATKFYGRNRQVHQMADRCPPISLFPRECQGESGLTDGGENDEKERRPLIWSMRRRDHPFGGCQLSLAPDTKRRNSRCRVFR